MAFYFFKRRPQPTPGVLDMAFLPSTSLPVQYFLGSGSPIAKQLSLTLPANLIVMPSYIQNGLAGIPAGSIGQRPLENLEDVLSAITAGSEAGGSF